MLLKELSGLLQVLTVLTYSAPGNVGLDKQCPPEAPKYTQQDERGQLHQMPGSVKLHVEQDQAAVPKRVDGAQSESCHQCRKEGTPERLQGEVITHLDGTGEGRVFV